MAVIDIARTTVVTASPDTSVADVVRKLHDEEVAGLVVVNDGKPLDLVTSRDLLPAVLDDQFDAESTPVEEFIDGDIPTVEADEGMYDTVEVMSERGIRRLPVVEDGQLVGIISISDVVVLLGMELQHVATAIRSSSPAYERDGFDYYDG
ncbi:CBS domain-containing protein [Halovenus halobia]|uniref:CBS domain-containing protein n=1 Tax=Halovenus halobia TaxID=3396622 RepID=UPI003F54C04A